MQVSSVVGGVALVGRAAVSGGRVAVPTWVASPWGAFALDMLPTKMGDGTLTAARVSGHATTDEIMHRGRIQAQGGGLEASVSWAQMNPPTTSDGEIMLETLKAQLTERQINDRIKGFSQAERFINNAGNAGGVNAPVSRSFPQGSSIRVDIEIITGQAFVP